MFCNQSNACTHCAAAALITSCCGTATMQADKQQATCYISHACQSPTLPTSDVQQGRRSLYSAASSLQLYDIRAPGHAWPTSSGFTSGFNNERSLTARGQNVAVFKMIRMNRRGCCAGRHAQAAACAGPGPSRLGLARLGERLASQARPGRACQASGRLVVHSHHLSHCVLQLHENRIRLTVLSTSQWQQDQLYCPSVSDPLPLNLSPNTCQ
jgi:hypothetical protein